MGHVTLASRGESYSDFIVPRLDLHLSKLLVQLEELLESCRPSDRPLEDTSRNPTKGPRHFVSKTSWLRIALRDGEDVGMLM